MTSIEKKAIEYRNQFKVYNKACNYLKNRGFMDTRRRRELIEENYLGMSTCKGDYFYGYLVFPIHDKSGKLVSFTGRSIMDGITPPHKHWYGTIDYFYNHAAIKSALFSEIFITESPLDTLSLTYYNYSSIATMGSSRLPSNYKDLQDKRILILFDTDLNNSGQSKAKLLASRLYSICESIRIGSIPLPPGYKKIDVNDLLKQGDLTSDIDNIITKSVKYVYEPPVKISYTSKHDFSGYDIISIMSDQIDLTPVGNLYKAHCPFHNDSDPSFTVYPETSSYFCWGCEKGGDIISFLQELMGYEFMEAKKYLEINYG